MAQQSQAQALAALAEALEVESLDEDNWHIDQWRDAHIINSKEARYGSPSYLVLNGKVALLDFARSTPEVTYAQLAGA